MRIHTSATAAQIRSAATAGLPGVYAESLTEHGSKTHARAFELTLSGSGRQSQYGYSDNRTYVKSATWDEWGVVMARIFAIDPDTRMGGSAKRPVYANAEDFRWQTGGRFGYWWEPSGTFVANPLPEDTHVQHKWEWVGSDATHSYSVAQCKKCSALKRWRYVQQQAA